MTLCTYDVKVCNIWYKSVLQRKTLLKLTFVFLSGCR